MTKTFQEQLEPINKVLRFVLFKVLRLRQHSNNIGVHFYLPFHSQLLFRCDIGFARVSLFFPGFISISVKRLARTSGLPSVKVYQIYGGLKEDGTQSKVLGEPDYLLSIAARHILVPSDASYNSMAAF